MNNNPSVQLLVKRPVLLHVIENCVLSVTNSTRAMARGAPNVLDGALADALKLHREFLPVARMPGDDAR